MGIDSVGGPTPEEMGINKPSVERDNEWLKGLQNENLFLDVVQRNGLEAYSDALKKSPDDAKKMAKTSGIGGDLGHEIAQLRIKDVFGKGENPEQSAKIQEAMKLHGEASQAQDKIREKLMYKDRGEVTSDELQAFHDASKKLYDYLEGMIPAGTRVDWISNRINENKEGLDDPDVSEKKKDGIRKDISLLEKALERTKSK